MTDPTSSSPSTTTQPTGKVIRIERDIIDATTMGGMVLDPGWTYTDKAGHEHRAAGGYPTLKLVVDRTYFCVDCRDEHQDDHWECPDCGETIVPGTKYEPPNTSPILGRTRYYVDEVEVTEMEAMKAMALEPPDAP